MAIIGIGIDIVEVSRIEALLSQHEERFLERVFTPAEQSHSADRKSRPLHLAARFAAKEAAMKALGTGLASGISWQDVEVVPLPTGAPTLALHAKALERSIGIGAKSWTISLTHTDSYAAAVVIAEA